MESLTAGIRRIAGCSQAYAEELEKLIETTPAGDQLDILCSHVGAGSALREEFAMLLQEEGPPDRAGGEEV